MLADVHPHIVWSLDPAPLIPVVLFAYQYGVCGQSGGAFVTGGVPTGTEACADPSHGVVGTCGGSAPAYPAPISVCCQGTPTYCYSATVADGSEYSQWYWSCAYTYYFSYRVVIGSCGADGRCTPAH